MFFKKILTNGLTVIMEKRQLEIVSLSISNRFGASSESSSTKGISHFIEHLLFTGTKTRGHEQISGEIEKKGGILNAFTSRDVTSFWFKLPSEHVFSGLDILIDILKNPVFDYDKFQKERKVILEEIKMYHDIPQRFVFDMIESNLYEGSFGEPIIGSRETVNSLTRDFVYDYYRANYSPENYIVSIVGNVDFEKICAYLESNLVVERKMEVRNVEVKRKNAESLEEREGIDQAHFVFAIHSPMMGSKEFYALEILDAYLTGGMSSKLFLKIREEKGLAYSVKGSISSEKNYSYYSIYVGTRKDALDEVKKLIIEGFENVKDMTQKDLDEIKEQVIGLMRLSSEESSNVMNELLFNELVGNAENYYMHEENIRNVKLEDVKRLAKLDDYSTAAIVPK